MDSDPIEWDIADDKVQRIAFDQRFCQVFNDDFRFRIKLFQDSAGYRVQFHGQEVALDIFRHHSDKMTDARPELPETPARDSSGSGNPPHEFDQHFRRIMAVQR